MFDYYTLLRFRHRVPILPIAAFLKPGHGGLTLGRHEEWTLTHRAVLFEYFLVALPDVSSRSLDGDNPVTYALFPLLADTPVDPVDRAEVAWLGISRTEPDAARQEVLLTFFRHYNPLSPEQVAALELWLERNSDAGVNMTYTYIDEIVTRRSIRAVLDARFGQLPPEVDAVPNRTTEEAELNALLRAAATASSLVDFMNQANAILEHPNGASSE